MLFNSIFFFSHNVFKSLLSQHFTFPGLLKVMIVWLKINSLSNDKIFYMSKLKVFAFDKAYIT